MGWGHARPCCCRCRTTLCPRCRRCAAAAAAPMPPPMLAAAPPQLLPLPLGVLRHLGLRYISYDFPTTTLCSLCSNWTTAATGIPFGTGCSPAWQSTTCRVRGWFGLWALDAGCRCRCGGGCCGGGCCCLLPQQHALSCAQICPCLIQFSPPQPAGASLPGASLPQAWWAGRRRCRSCSPASRSCSSSPHCAISPSLFSRPCRPGGLAGAGAAAVHPLHVGLRGAGGSRHRLAALL